MTPPCYTFAAAELQERVQLDVHGRQRKMVPGAPSPTTISSQQAESRPVNGGPEKAESIARSPHKRYHGIDLARDCTLLSNMVQYSCAVMHPEMRDSPVRCWPVQRIFRRCKDRHGSFMVETTAWEGNDYASQTGSENSSAGNTVANLSLSNGSGVLSASAHASTSTRSGSSQRPETLCVFG